LSVIGASQAGTCGPMRASGEFAQYFMACSPQHLCPLWTLPGKGQRRHLPSQNWGAPLLTSLASPGAPGAPDWEGIGPVPWYTKVLGDLPRPVTRMTSPHCPRTMQILPKGWSLSRWRHSCTHVEQPNTMHNSLAHVAPLERAHARFTLDSILNV
jgi:hypothetical protein